MNIKEDYRKIDRVPVGPPAKLSIEGPLGITMFEFSHSINEWFGRSLTHWYNTSIPSAANTDALAGGISSTSTTFAVHYGHYHHVAEEKAKEPLARIVFTKFIMASLPVLTVTTYMETCDSLLKRRHADNETHPSRRRIYKRIRRDVYESRLINELRDCVSKTYQ